MIFQGLGATLLFVLTAGGAAGAGRALWRRLGGEAASETETTLVGATLGLGLLVLGTGALCALHALTAWGAAGLILLLWLAAWRELAPMAACAGRARALAAAHPAAAACVLAPLALTFWATWIPPYQYDSLLYHLALAQAYVRAHTLVEVPNLLYSYFPHNGELLFGLALSLGSDQLAQMFVWLAAALSVWWIFDAARRETSLLVAWLAALLLCAHTSFLLLASTTYIEPLMMLFTTGAALSLYRWLGEARPTRWLALSALLAGLGLGAKYYGGISAALLGAAVLVASAKRGRWRDAAVFFGVTAALFAPWLLRNARLTGDPAYPFLYQAFARSREGVLGEMAEAFLGIAASFSENGRWRDLFGPGAGGVDVLGGLGWQATLLTFPLGLWVARRTRFLSATAWFCLGYLALWYFTGPQVRFLTALSPLLCLLGAAGLAGLWAASNAVTRVAVAAAAGLLLAYQFGLFFYVHALMGSDKALFGRESRDEFLALRVGYYPCARFAAEHLPLSDRLLLVGEQGGYFVEQEYEAGNAHARTPHLAWADHPGGPAALIRLIQDNGYQHVLFAPREARRLGIWAEISSAGRGNWTALAASPSRLVFSAPHCSVSSLSPPPPAAGSRR